MSEWMLASVAAATPLRYAALRYFNVAGSDSGGRVGQATPKATLLIKVACEVAVGKRTHLSVFGTDYPTGDGTGVRDYIHVEDLATAHLDALDLPARRGRLDHPQRRLRPRLQRAPGDRQRAAGDRQDAHGQGGAPPGRRPPGAGRARGADPHRNWAGNRS